MAIPVLKVSDWEDVYVSYSQQKPHLLERASNKYGKSLSYAEHSSNQVSEDCLSNQKEFLFQRKC